MRPARSDDMQLEDASFRSERRKSDVMSVRSMHDDDISPRHYRRDERRDSVQSAASTSSRLPWSSHPRGNGELVMCVPLGGLIDFATLHTFPTHVEYNIVTFFAATNTVVMYRPGGDFAPIAASRDNLGFAESDVWTSSELSNYGSETLFKRGLAKMAVAAISYKIEHFTGLVHDTTTASKATRKKLRKSIVRLQSQRTSLINYLLSRTQAHTKANKKFNDQDLILRIVAVCYDEFLSDVRHPNESFENRGSMQSMCTETSSMYNGDKAILKELLVPPGIAKTFSGLSLEMVVDDVFLSGSMPMFRDYLNSYVVFKRVNPEELSLRDILVNSDIRNEVFSSIFRSVPYFGVVSVDIILRGIAQVYLCNHPVSGLLISIGLFLTFPELLMFAIVGCIGSTLASFMVCRETFVNIQSGLCGYDGTLVGCSVYTFISLTSQQPADVDNAGLFCAFLLAAIAGVVHSAIANSSQLPALTAAFNIVMLFFMMSIGRGTSDAAQLQWSTPYDTDNFINATAVDGEIEFDSLTPRRLWRAVVLGVGQFVFVSTEVGAIFVIIGVVICSRKAAFMAVVGSLMGTLVSMYLVDVPKGSYESLWNGLFSYNCMGTAVAIGGDIFYEFNFGSFFLATVGSAMAAFWGLGIQSLLAADGLNLPVMTIPFVVTAWLLMSTGSQWLVPTVAADVDLDDAMFLDRRHEHEDSDNKVYVEDDDPPV